MLSPFNVLHADDDQNDRELLKLAAFRHTVPIRVSEAGDGVEVIEYLQGTGRFADRARHPLPDLLLMELTMPRLNGFAVLEWLQDHSTFRSIPAIVLSASSFEQDIQEAYRCGAKTYFTKPVEPSGYKKLLDLLVDYWITSQRSKPLPEVCTGQRMRPVRLTSLPYFCD